MRTTSRARATALIAAGLASAPTLAAADAGADDPEGPNVTVGGYLQPQLRVRQNSDADNDTDGFRFRRARLLVSATQAIESIDVGAELEGESTPEFQLLDAYVWARGKGLPLGGRWQVDLGQVKAPFSRQTLLSESRLQFVERAELGSLGPDRQVGARAGVTANLIGLSVGVFNGEGRNQVQNIDENLLYAARLELRPFGRDAAFAEGGWEDHLTLAANVFKNKLDIGDGVDDILGFGGDLSAAWHGVSVSAEYVQIDHEFPEMIQTDYTSKGWAGQVGYLLPLGGFFREKLEVAGRVEEIDRNDAVPVDNPGDPNQSLRLFTGNLSFYQARHGLKVQASYAHIVEVEQEDRTGGDIRHPNDMFLLQVTYRLE